MKKRHLWLVALSFIISICMCFSLAACRDSNEDEITPVALTVPVVSIDSDGVATWDNVPDASGYAYKINDGEEKTAANRSVTLTDKQSISVKAVGDGENYTDSGWSKTKTYTAPSDNSVKLGKPEVSIITDSTTGTIKAKWRTLTGAIGFTVQIKEKGADAWNEPVTFIYCTIELTEGQSIRVKAVGDGTNYATGDWSDVKTASSVEPPVEPVKLGKPEVSIKTDSTTSTIKAEWEAVTGANGYSVQIKEKGADDWDDPVTITLCAIELTEGKSIRVKAIGNGTNYTDGDWSDVKIVPINDTPVNHVHDYSYTINENGTHSAVCNGAGECDEPITNVAHVYGEDGKCVCGAVKPEPPVDHVHDYSYTINENGTHSAVCNGAGECDEPITNVAHVYGEDGKCVCGAVKPVQPVKLGTPVVTIDEDGLASWPAVTGATKYKVDVDGVVTEQAKTTTKQLVDGEKIKVQAVGNGTTYLTGEWSAEQTYNAPSELPQLDAPKVTINNETGLVSWTAVDHATGYVYKIGKNGTELPYDENNPIYLTEDEQTVYVKAVAEGYKDSDWDSETYSPVPDNPELKDLGTPVVKITENNGVGTASWTAIEGATSYTYRINGGTIETTTELSVGNLQPGDSITVRAWSTNSEYEDKGKACEEVVFYAKLATPEVTLTGAVATWADVPGATSYVYKTSATGTEKTAPGNTVTLTDGQSIQVKAKGNPATHKDSDWSAAKKYTAPQATKLDKPLVTMSETGLASWTAIANASKYVYKINGGAEVEVAADATLSVQLKNNESIVVTAIGDVDTYLDSDPSAAKSYIVSDLAATLAFDDVAKCGTQTTLTQVWTENNITFTNNKGSTDVAKYSPVRCYKGSDIKIEYAAMTKVVFTCASGYCLKLESTDKFTVIGSGSTSVTVILSSAANKLEIAELDNQVRISKLDVYTARVAQPLGTPANLKIDEYGVATWDAVDNAVKYAYRINDGDKQFTDGRSIQLEDGQRIKVSAVGDGVDYKSANTPTENKTYRLETIDLKVKITLNSGTGVATWDALKGAKKYVYTVLDDNNNSVEDKTNVETATPVSVTLDPNYTLKVKAIGDGKVYFDSEEAEVKYEVTVIDLAKPTVVVERDGTVKISCDNALSFDYTVDGGATQNVAANANGAATLDKLLAYSDGVMSRTIVVKSIGNGEGGNVHDSTETTSVTYVKPGTLTAPVVTVTYEGTTAGKVTVSWTGDSHATGYKYSVGSGAETTVAAGATSITLENFKENETVVKIIAIGVENEPANGADYSSSYNNSEAESKLIIDKTVTYSVSEIIKVMNFYGSTFPDDNFTVQGVVSNSSYNSSSSKYAIWLYNDIADSEGKKQEKAFEFYNSTFDASVDEKYKGADYQKTDAFKYYTITATGQLKLYNSTREFNGCTISSVTITDADRVDAAIKALSSKAPNPTVEIEDNMYTYTFTVEGSYDTTISWSMTGLVEDDDDVYSNGMLLVGRPASGSGSKTVTATAYVTYGEGEGKVSKQLGDPIELTIEEKGTLVTPPEPQDKLVLTINKDYFNSTSYNANNNTKTIDGYEVTSNQVMKQSDDMQFQSGKGTITVTGTFTKLVIKSSAGTFTVTAGSTALTNSNGTYAVTTTGEQTITIAVGNATGKVSEITFYAIDASNYTDEEKVEKAFAALPENIAYNINGFDVDVEGILDTTINWTVTLEDGTTPSTAVTIDGDGHATVTRGENDIVVKIHAQVTLNGETSELKTYGPFTVNKTGTPVETWQKVTSLSELVDGAQIILAYTADSGDVAMTTTLSSASGGYYNSIEQNFTKDIGTTVAILTVKVNPTNSNQFALMLGDQYLAIASNSNAKMKLDSNEFYWTIDTINSNVDKQTDGTIQITGSTGGRLQYNTSAPRFANYTTASQKDPFIYIQK